MPQQTITPLHVPYTAGEPFEFGSHSNDFLLRREQALATETFTVRIPGQGAVPEHVHTDMEQTFLFLAGVGEASLRRGDDVRRHTCRPGDMLFVPTGWHHTVAAPGIEGCVYVTVNAFLPEGDRIGDSAIEHAEIAAAGFRTNTPTGAFPSADGLDTVALLRCAEAAFRLDLGGVRMWPQDFTAFDATLTGDPDTYRVRRLGPFEYVTPVTPVPRVLDAVSSTFRTCSPRQRPTTLMPPRWSLPRDSPRASTSGACGCWFRSAVCTTDPIRSPHLRPASRSLPAAPTPCGPAPSPSP
ncbi:MAG: cupin domain-containing protein [Streptomycetaceae bacterium]|nr:cupin domain-containing protein [Streptomycetaceae bacterium]